MADHSSRTPDEGARAGPRSGRTSDAERARELMVGDASAYTREDVRHLVHELSVHQSELEIQNEQLRAAQTALEESRARYFDLYEQAPVGYLTVGAGDLIRDVNRYGAALLGRNAAALVGRRIRDFIVADDVARFGSMRDQLSESGIQQRLELQLTTAHGPPFHADVQINVARRDKSGEQLFRLAFTDVSDRVLTTRQLAEAMSELQRSELALREADRRKDEFLATLAHELRNPLAPIRNAITVMRFTPGGNARLDWCREVIERQVNQMAALLEDLMDVSRVTHNRISLHRARVELSSAIAQAVETVRPLIESRNHSLVVNLPTVAVELDGDITRLTQIFGNLLNNAAKYTEPGGTIDVTAEVVDELAIVRVRDSGIGVEPRDAERIFELFSQVDARTDRTQGGLGIGLSLVRALVELHGGSITAESEGAGRGATFVVTLPTVRTPRPAAANGTEAAERPMEPKGRVLRILVVDDNQDVTDSLSLLLRTWGHEVRGAVSGSEAFAVAEDFRPQVCFLDLGLPDIDGHELARRLRRCEWGREIMLVACSGRGQPEDRARSTEAGIDHHLVKPIDPDSLKLVLRQQAVATQHQLP